MPQQKSATCNKNLPKGALWVKGAYDNITKRGYYRPGKSPVVKLLQTDPYERKKGCVRTAKSEESKNIRKKNRDFVAAAKKAGVKPDYTRTYVSSHKKSKSASSAKRSAAAHAASSAKRAARKKVLSARKKTSAYKRGREALALKATAAKKKAWDAKVAAAERRVAIIQALRRGEAVDW